MNGGDFAGMPYGDSFQQHHNQQNRIRSMSWCDGPEITTTTQMGEMPPIHLAQEEVTLSPDPNLGRNEIEMPSCSTEVINLKKPSARKNAWGCLSYADLIAKAIESSPNQRLTLNQIYSWMVENVPYFRAKGHTNSSAGWKNSIRHNLSLHGRFVRVQNEGAGKSSWWMVNNNNRLQKTPRRRSSTLDSKSLDKKRKTTHSLDSSNLSNDPSNLSPFYKSSFHLQQQQMPFHFQYPPQQQQPPRLHKLDSFETVFRSLDRGVFNNNVNSNNINRNNHNFHNSHNKNIPKSLNIINNYSQYNSNNMFHVSSNCFNDNLQQQSQHMQQQQQVIFNEPVQSISSSTPNSINHEIMLNNSNSNKLSFNNSYHDNSLSQKKSTLQFVNNNISNSNSNNISNNSNNISNNSNNISNNNNHQQQQQNMVHIYHPSQHHSKTSSLPTDIFSMPEEAWRNYLPPSPDQLTETVISSESLTAFLESGAESEMVDLVPAPLMSVNSNVGVVHDNNNNVVVEHGNNNNNLSDEGIIKEEFYDDVNDDNDTCNNNNKRNNNHIIYADSSIDHYKSDIFCNDTSSLDKINNTRINNYNNNNITNSTDYHNESLSNHDEFIDYSEINNGTDNNNNSTSPTTNNNNNNKEANKILEVQIVNSKHSSSEKEEDDDNDDEDDDDCNSDKDNCYLNRSNNNLHNNENCVDVKTSVLTDDCSRNCNVYNNNNNNNNNTHDDSNTTNMGSANDVVMGMEENCHKPLLYNILQNNTLSTSTTTFNPNNNSFDHFTNCKSHKSNTNNKLINKNISQTRDDFYPKIVELLSSGNENSNLDVENKIKNNINNTNLLDKHQTIGNFTTLSNTALYNENFEENTCSTLDSNNVNCIADETNDKSEVDDITVDDTVNLSHNTRAKSLKNSLITSSHNTNNYNKHTENKGVKRGSSKNKKERRESTN